ncbi:hypothetical protein D1BOALGB6SA_4072 [Olavius sp. associated proteobacterium Delta 1]|nr:hypothetical protein D1BOALGB6SA_4072 [Olavius sp. associated proteobacterium Delta 1]
MVLTRDFKETIKDRVAQDPALREELLKQGIECLSNGDVDTGKAVLRDYINATIGLDALGTVTDRSPERTHIEPCLTLELALCYIIE